jgi:predicted oxidoreductase
VAETNERIEAARAAGGTVVHASELPFAAPPGIAVHVAAGVTHTLGGLRVDTHARVLGADGIWAAGVDAGGVALGGYASGLAQALVLGLVAAEDLAAPTCLQSGCSRCVKPPRDTRTAACRRGAATVRPS